MYGPFLEISLFLIYKISKYVPDSGLLVCLHDKTTIGQASSFKISLSIKWITETISEYYFNQHLENHVNYLVS